MSDTFRADFAGTAGTLLSAYTPIVGLPVSNSLSGDPLLTDHNSIRTNPAATGFSRFQDDPTSADYAVTVDAKFWTVVNDQGLQIALRYVPGEGSPRVSMIYDGTNPDGPVLYIADQSSGFDVITGPIDFVATVGAIYTFLFQVSGTTYTVFVNGTNTLEGSSSSLSAAGHPVFLLTGASSSTTGLQLSKMRTFPTGAPSPALAMAPNDAKVLYDPVGWNVTADRALSVNPGSRFRFKFSGSTYVRAYFDTSAYASDTMDLAWRIGTEPWQTATLAHGTDHIDFATELDGTEQTLNFQIVAMPQTDPFSATPVDAVLITGFEVDLFGSFAAVSDAQPNRGFAMGDSITRQSHAGPGDTDDSRYTWPSFLFDAFQAEWSNVSFGGIGWLTDGIGMSMPFFTPGSDSASAWNKIITGVPRVFTDIDFIVVFVGTNDGGHSDDDISASVAGWLGAAREACPIAKIFIVTPFYAGAAGVTQGFNAYQDTPDLDAFLVDLGSLGAKGVTSYPTASWLSPDGLHFNTLKHSQFGAMVAQAMQASLGGSSPSGGNGINGTSILGMI